MTQTAESYATRQVTIQAKHWDGSIQNAGDIIDWILENGGTATFRETNETQHREHPEIRVYTLEGVMVCSPTDWIIQGTEGEFYPCKDSVFQRKYYKL
jgi:hypothetical protein